MWIEEDPGSKSPHVNMSSRLPGASGCSSKAEPDWGFLPKKQVIYFWSFNTHTNFMLLLYGGNVPRKILAGQYPSEFYVAALHEIGDSFLAGQYTSEVHVWHV